MPTASGTPEALRALVAPFADARSATSAGRSGSPAPAASNEEGAYWRYEMAVRELESGLGGITAGNGGDLRGPPRRLRAAASPPAATTSPSRSRWPSAACASVYVPAALAEEKMVPTLEGEFAPQAADDGRPLGHRGRRGDVVAARLRAAVRASRSSPTGCSATRARSCTWSRSPTNIALLGQGVRLRGDPRASGRRLLAAAAVAPLRAAQARCGSPATTCWSPPRSPSGSGTAAKGPPGAWEKAEGTR